MWGGWTCTGCGAELNSRGQPIDRGGAIATADHVKVTLRSPTERRDRVMVTLGALSPLLALLTAALGIGLGSDVIVGSGFLSTAALLGAALLFAVRLFRTHAVTISDVAIRWGSHTVAPEAIEEVTVDGPRVQLHTASGETHTLEPAGGPDALVEAIAQARRADRAIGTPADVPVALRQRSSLRQP